MYIIYEPYMQLLRLKRVRLVIQNEYICTYVEMYVCIQMNAYNTFIDICMYTYIHIDIYLRFILY